MKMQKGATVGNVTNIGRPKNWFEQMSYSELLAERRFLRAEIKRVERARDWASKVDPRCMWGPETSQIDQLFAEMIKACEHAIQFYCEKEMIRRMSPNAGPTQ